MSEPPAKRRKVRKGTRSCWECRRRKIKCQFSKEDDPICIGCTQRETSCISQEYVPTPPAAPQDKRLAQRLGRLEELMEKLVDKPLPSPESEDPALERFTQHTADVFESSVVDNAQQILDQPDAAIVTPRFPSRSAKAMHVSAQLHALFPSQQILYAISQQSPGARFVLAMFYSQQDQIDGKPEPLSALAQIPPVTSHPAILAKRLLQLAVCLQQMPPYFDGSTLGLSKPPRETMEEWIAVTGRLVTSDDDFVGCLEGLECLILQSFYQSDAGHLRKAWLTGRRALNMAQLMGIDRKSAKSIKSVDPSFSNKHRPSPPVIWFRINCNDRYVSLILGLPIGSRDNSFAEDNALVSDAPSDKLGKVYAMMAGKIADRNELKGSEAYVLTQSIDMELEKAYKMMDDGLWWKLPDMAICCGTSDASGDGMSVIKLQIRHFSLLILLHLPYLLRDRGQRRYEYNRATCMQASRDVLDRFLEYRNCFTTSISGRHVDYSALVAAMTLLLGYLGWRWPGYETEKEHDRDLAEKTQERMQEMGALNNDRLCIEAAETIRQLLPIVQRQSGTSGENVHLNVPFLGTVNINPGPTPPASTASMMASNSTTPSGNVDMSQFPLSFNSPSFGSENCDLSTTCAFAPDVLDSNWPCFTADPEDWALQGVDTTYWTMLNSSIA
ncbi:c6 zinc finger [Fusarium pseudoanthophilum]|uniref:C6 zinc finger n=1 Tax=Fusarium pseudoanthophilum TaxID=48495 RepID=A0A8H5K3I4_9HYPO|nr:c6 zinc finger [Fusarium pseudoanthophilum]